MGIINTNFKGVIEKGDYESGDYLFAIKDASPENGKNGPYVRLALQFMDGKYAGLFTEENVSFAEKALWRAKAFLKAVGYEVPEGPFSFDTKDLLELSFRCHAEREVDPTGKFPPKLKITQFWNKDYVPPNLAPESAAQTPAPGAPLSSPASAPASAPAAPAAAPAAAPSEPPARPKLKV